MVQIKSMKKIITTALILFSFQSFAQDCVPPFSKAVWLPGIVKKVGSTWYLVDKSGNGYDFTINGTIDFDSTNIEAGFRFKTGNTISAPAGNATLQALDDSFLYRNGVPQQLPPTAFFPNHNYGNKMFCKIWNQVLNWDGREVIEPRIQDFVIYNTALTGTDLLRANDYFNVPSQDTATTSPTGVVWLAEFGGNDANAGTYESPKRSITGLASSTKTLVYLKSGAYDFSSAPTFTGSAITFQGTGYCTFYTTTAANGMTIQRDINFKNLEIKDTATSSCMNIQANVTVDRCRLIQRTGSYFFLMNSSGKNLTVSNYLVPFFTGTSLVRNNNAPGAITLSGAYGKIVNSFQSSQSAANVIIKHSKGTSGSSQLLYTTGLTYKDNTALGGLINNNTLTSYSLLKKETIVGNVGLSGTVLLDSLTITGAVSGSPDSILNTIVNGTAAITAKDNQLFRGDSITTTSNNTTPLSITAVQGSNVTGIIVESTILTGNMSSANYLFRIGAPVEGDTAAVYNYIVRKLRVINNSTAGTGTCHTTFFGGFKTGSWFEFYDSYLKVNNGYGSVIKTGGMHLDTTKNHIRTNVYEITGTPSFVVYNKGTWGLKVNNNTIINAKAGVSIAETNDNLGAGLDNSMQFINNAVWLAANVGNYTTNNAWMTTTNNTINKNGFTCTTSANDIVVTTAVDANGVPASRLNNGATLATPNNTLLAQGYRIPTNLLYFTQDATIQCGAIGKP
jgi:hypothetical protein